MTFRRRPEADCAVSQDSCGLHFLSPTTLQAVRCHKNFESMTMRTSLLVLTAHLLFLVYLPTGSAASSNPQSAHEGYQVAESGHLGRAGVFRQDIYWLDDDRIVFVGVEPGEFRTERGRRVASDNLYVWNVKTAKIRKHAELSWNASLCVSGNYVRFNFARAGVEMVAFGDFAREHEHELDIQAMKDGILAVSPVSCQEYNPKRLKKRYGANPLPLRNRGEYLDRTTGHYVEPLRYFPADGGEPVKLAAIPNRDVNTTPIYSAFAKKYVFGSWQKSIDSRAPKRMYLLDKSGDVQHYDTPVGSWMGGRVHALPAATGWILTSTAVGQSQSIGAAGVYLAHGQRTIRLIKGIPYTFAISPNGCGVAVSIDMDWGRASAPRIVALNVCPRGTRLGN